MIKPVKEKMFVVLRVVQSVSTWRTVLPAADRKDARYRALKILKDKDWKRLDEDFNEIKIIEVREWVG